MTKSQYSFLKIGSILMAISVALGAVGAHLLKNTLPAKELETFLTGVRYQTIHSLSLIILSLLPKNNYIKFTGTLFLAGIIFFSFGCYAYALTGIKSFVHIVPIGGISFITGWVILFFSKIKKDKI